MLDRANRITTHIVTEEIIENFVLDELRTPKTGPEYDDVFGIIKFHLMNADILGVTIWDNKHRVIWSHEKQLVGQRFLKHEYLAKALEGKTVSRVVSDRELKKRYEYEKNVKQLIVRYIPIRFESQEDIAIVCEIHENMQSLFSDIVRHKRIIWTSSIIGFLAFYLVLYGVVWGASGNIKSQHKEIALSEERYKKASDDWRITFDSTKEIIMMCDSDFRIVKANRAATQFFGSTYSEFLKGSVYELLAGEGADMEILQKMREEMKHVEVDMFFENKGAWFLVSSDPIIDEAGKFKGAVFIMRDLMELKKAEEEQKMLQAQLLQAQKMESVGRLAGGIAHDFNNILSIIIGSCEVLFSNLPEDHAAQDFLNIIMHSGKKGVNLINKLLAFSRKQFLEMRVINLNATVENMANILGRMIGADVKLSLKTKASTRNIMADPGQIEQILMNLVINARDAMPSGGSLIIETADCEISEEQVHFSEEFHPGFYVMLAVADSGSGMSREIQEKMFEPFYSTKEKGKGTGLGLSTVYGIVKQHSGHIEVDSEVGKGTTFKIYFPVTEGELEEVAISELGPIPWGKEVLLVVEDEIHLHRLIPEMLSPLGYEFLMACSAEEAMELSRSYKGHIDLLLTDVILPGMNGRQLADEIKSHRPDMKVIYISGYAFDTITRSGIIDSAVDYIQKPLTTEKLAVEIRKVLDQTE